MTGYRKILLFIIIGIFLFTLSFMLKAEEKVCTKDIFLSPKDKIFLLSIARKSIEHHFAGKKYSPDLENFNRLEKIRAGAFITIDRHGKIKGCRGTLNPCYPNIVREVCRMSVASAMGGERYSPMKPGELKNCRISITIVTGFIPISTVNDVPKSDGIVFMTGEKAGVVLPYEGSDPYIRLKWAYLKAGLEPDKSLFKAPLKDVYLMKAIRFADGDADLKSNDDYQHC